MNTVITTVKPSRRNFSASTIGNRDEKQESSKPFMPSICAIALLLAIGLTGGCALGPDFKKPVVDDMPGGFLGQGVVSRQMTIADLPWWDLFDDDMLHDLVQAALANNYDLRIAVKRVEEYHAIAAQARAQFFPQVGYQGNLERERNAFGGRPAPGAGETDNPLALAATAAWEVDLWGRIRRMNEAARAQLAASNEARRGIMLTLVCNVIQSYFELLELDLELEIAKRTMRSFQESLDIFSLRLASGAASRLETSRAEAALASTAAMIPDLERRIVIKENQINLLLGRNPGQVPRHRTLSMQDTLPEVPAGLPSDLLRRRPDIRMSEEMLRAANAQIGAAIADLFPKIGLTALFGRASPDLDSFNRDAMAWNIGGNMTGPIFEGGARVAQVRQARAQCEATAIAYESTVRTAFQEVANTLITRLKLEDMFIQQARCVRCYTDAVIISRERYLAGKAGYYEVLEAQQELFPAENTLAQVQLNRLLAVIQLYKVLGGGWNLPDEEWSKTP